jgi:DUF1680 family protein
MELFNEKAKKLVKNMVIATMPKIKVEAGVCRYNFRCQYNSVHDALNDEQDKIAMCFYLDEDYPIIHFLNIDNEGNYIDNTLGRWAETVEYYLIRTIDKESFFKIDDIFTAYRKELKLKFPWYVRWFSNCDF